MTYMHVRRAATGALLVLLIGSWAGAAQWYVDAERGDDSYSGAAATVGAGGAGPKATVKAAIDAASSGDVITLAPGQYSGEGNWDLDLWGKALTIRGAGAEETVLDAGGGAQGQHRFFMVQGSASVGSVIDGVTMRGGNVGSAWGGAIICEFSSLTVRDCVLENNVSGGRGGAIYCGDGVLVLEGSTVRGNTAQDGGGIYAIAATVTVTSSDFYNNEAHGDTFRGKGAAVALAEASQGTLAQCEFEGNLASNFGGAVWTQNSSAELTNCLLAGNRANSYGGAAYGENAELTLANCTLSGNVSRWYGGGIHAHGTTAVNLRNSICWSNAIGQEGAGPQLAMCSGTSLSTAYSNIQGGMDAVRTESGCLIEWDMSNLEVAPRFARLGQWHPTIWPAETAAWWSGDYHLQSTAGRWEEDSAGRADFNDDAVVNLADFGVMTGAWMSQEAVAADITGDGVVDQSDLAVLTADYLRVADLTGKWVQDNLDSPLLDAGDPSAPAGSEPAPNGTRVNLGAYGGTAEASLTPAAG